MSRKDAPNYRVHDGCFYCKHRKPACSIGEEISKHKCLKHNFIFDEDNDEGDLSFLGGEMNIRVCDDYKIWERKNEP